MTAAGLEISLALPQHWQVLPLDNGDRLRRLVAERVGRAPHLARFRQRLLDDLRFLIEQAVDRQVLAAASMTLALEVEVVGASLLVAMGRSRCPDLRSAGDRRRADVLSLPRIGSTLRTLRLLSLAAPHASNPVPLLHVQYTVPVHAADMCVLLTFTSPSLVYETALVEMFDMITSSLSVHDANVDVGGM